MRCAVCRCFLGAWRSPCRIWSIKGITACSFGCGRSVFLRGLGKALAIASRTIRRCTFTFLATPAIVPTPNSYSRRISSKSSTLALQSNGFPLSGYSPIQGIRSLPRWAKLDRRTGPIQSTEISPAPGAGSPPLPPEASPPQPCPSSRWDGRTESWNEDVKDGGGVVIAEDIRWALSYFLNPRCKDGWYRDRINARLVRHNARRMVESVPCDWPR